MEWHRARIPVQAMTQDAADPTPQPSTSVQVAALAYAAGFAGRRYMDWTLDDAVQRHVDDQEVDSAGWAAAYEQGLLDRRRAVEGWLERWTTAPADYDVQGTATLAVDGTWRDRPLRRVLVQPMYERYQVDRYASGLYGAWHEDPRETERRLAEEWRQIVTFFDDGRLQPPAGGPAYGTGNPWRYGREHDLVEVVARWAP